MKIDTTTFGTLAGGENVTAYTIGNHHGYELRCMDYGATIIGFRAPDREGRADEITLRYDTFERYAAGHPFFGSTVGRVANRIDGAAFELDGRTWRLEANEGANTLHSGSRGFHAQLWRSEPFERAGHAGVLFHLVSPDGDQGFPGEVVVTVSVSLTDDDELHIEYHAEADRATPLNLTNHTYWNLAGAPERRRHRGEAVPAPRPRGGAIGEHEIAIYGDRYLELDDEAIPTGRILPVAGTPFDFTGPKPIGRDIEAAGGYDLCYVLTAVAERDASGESPTDGALDRAAMVRDPSTGRTMEVRTTSPALQFYSGNMLPQATDEFGEAFHLHDALCLETQYHPDAVNHDNFPSIVLQPGEVWQHRTVHLFGVE